MENRLTQSTDGAGGTVQYGYDATDQRIYQGVYNGSAYSGEEIFFYGVEGNKYGVWQLNPASGVLLKASVLKQWFANRLVSPQDRLDSRGRYFPFGQARTNVTPATRTPFVIGTVYRVRQRQEDILKRRFSPKAQVIYCGLVALILAGNAIASFAQRKVSEAVLSILGMPFCIYAVIAGIRKQNSQTPNTD